MLDRAQDQDTAVWRGNMLLELDTMAAEGTLGVGSENGSERLLRACVRKVCG
jgi:hypothetical protein